MNSDELETQLVETQRAIQALASVIANMLDTLQYSLALKDSEKALKDLEMAKMAFTSFLDHLYPKEK